MSAVLSRLCKGGCGATFTPPASRPGQEYVHGHKNGCDKERRRVAKPAQAASTASAEEDRHALNYKFALQSAERHAADLATRIDHVDDEIERLLQDLRALDRHKEMLTEKHLTVSTTAETLRILVEGKSIAREVAAVEVMRESDAILAVAADDVVSRRPA